MCCRHSRRKAFFLHLVYGKFISLGVWQCLFFSFCLWQVPLSEPRPLRVFLASFAASSYDAFSR